MQCLRVAGDQIFLKGDQEFAISGKQKGRVREETSVVSGTTEMSVQKPTPQTAPPIEPPTQRDELRRGKKNFRGWSLSGKFDRQPCSNFLKGI